ncbi:MAG: hypothetical protein ABI581_06065, partial [Sediminibacterium sp.]
ANYWFSLFHRLMARIKKWLNLNLDCNHHKISMRKIIISCCLFCLSLSVLRGQTVIVTDDSTYTIGQSSAVLDLKSTTKGFLPPRVTAAQKTAIVSPVAGLLVYQTDGTAGYYLWTGTKWDPLVSGSGGINVVAKVSTATLGKTETFVLASNSIILTLPVVTSSDNGLTITVKNTGTYTDLVQVKASGSSTIDGRIAASALTRWQARIYVAYEGNWILKEKELDRENSFDVSPNDSWTTIPEVLAFLALHMNSPSLIRLSGGTYSISSTQTINLPFALTISGLSFGATTIAAATGLTGSPMFSCASETSFKMLSFDATTLAAYGTAANEDGVWLTGAGNYHELKDNEFTGFNKAVVLKNNVEVFIFDTDIADAAGAGVEIAAGVASGVIFKISETDFTNCVKSISLVSGTNTKISVLNCGFYLNAPTSISINYVPATFTSIISASIAGNTWNNTGIFLQGFDFTRTDGRDANFFIVNNAGDPDHNPSCKINVLNNAGTTSLATSGNWYKANWTNTSSLPVIWAVVNNRITYLSLNKRDAIVIITGNLSNASTNRTISVGLVKNGINTVRYGETTLRITAASQPFQFSTVIYLQNISKNDYFELYCSSANNNETVTFQDIQWLTETK